MDARGIGGADFAVGGEVRVVEIQANNWKTAMDFVNALKGAIGAPQSPGSSPDAFIDSMIWHDDMNALKAPYTIKIIGLGLEPNKSVAG
jgi:hypothetical protein